MMRLINTILALPKKTYRLVGRKQAVSGRFTKDRAVEGRFDDPYADTLGAHIAQDRARRQQEQDAAETGSFRSQNRFLGESAYAEQLRVSGQRLSAAVNDSIAEVGYAETMKRMNPYPS